MSDTVRAVSPGPHTGMLRTQPTSPVFGGGGFKEVIKGKRGIGVDPNLTNWCLYKKRKGRRARARTEKGRVAQWEGSSLQARERPQETQGLGGCFLSLVSALWDYLHCRNCDLAGRP